MLIVFRSTRQGYQSLLLSRLDELTCPQGKTLVHLLLAKALWRLIAISIITVSDPGWGQAEASVAAFGIL